MYSFVFLVQTTIMVILTLSLNKTNWKYVCISADCSRQLEKLILKLCRAGGNEVQTKKNIEDVENQAFLTFGLTARYPAHFVHSGYWVL